MKSANTAQEPVLPSFNFATTSNESYKNRSDIQHIVSSSSKPISVKAAVEGPAKRLDRTVTSQNYGRIQNPLICRPFLQELLFELRFK